METLMDKIIKIVLATTFAHFMNMLTLVVWVPLSLNIIDKFFDSNEIFVGVYVGIGILFSILGKIFWLWLRTCNIHPFKITLFTLCLNIMVLFLNIITKDKNLLLLLRSLFSFSDPGAVIERLTWEIFPESRSNERTKYKSFTSLNLPVATIVGTLISGVIGTYDDWWVLLNWLLIGFNSCAVLIIFSIVFKFGFITLYNVQNEDSNNIIILPVFTSKFEIVSNACVSCVNASLLGFTSAAHFYIVHNKLNISVLPSSALYAVMTLLIIIAWAYTGTRIVDSRDINHIQCKVFSVLVMFLVITFSVITFFKLFITGVYIPLILILSILTGASIVTTIVKFQKLADTFGDMSLYIEQLVLITWPLSSFLSVPMVSSKYKTIMVSIYMGLVLLSWIIVLKIYKIKKT